MTPITDRLEQRMSAAKNSYDAIKVGDEAIETARALERIAGELYERLNNARDDVNEAIKEHIRVYGENYERKNALLAAMRLELSKVDAALARYQAMKDEATK